MAPKQPIELLLYKGKKHLTKQEIEERKASEIKAPNDRVTAPNYLNKDLKREFNKIAKQLKEIGIITNLDVDALGRFVLAQHMYEKVTAKMIELDPLDPDFNALVLNQDKFFKQARAAAGDLGLTISSRCKLVAPKKEDNTPQTKEQKLFGGKL